MENESLYDEIYEGAVSYALDFDAEIPHYEIDDIDVDVENLQATFTLSNEDGDYFWEYLYDHQTYRISLIKEGAL